MIRQIRQNELRELLDLYKHMHARDDSIPDEQSLLNTWDMIMMDPKIRYFVYETQKKLISCCHLVIVPNLTRGLRSYGLIENVVTHAEYRRKGFGAEVVRYAIKYAWSKNCYKVMLLSGRKSEAVFQFYESIGFDRFGKQAFIIESEDE